MIKTLAKPNVKTTPNAAFGRYAQILAAHGRKPSDETRSRLFAAAGSDENHTKSDPFGGFQVPSQMSTAMLIRAFNFSRIAGRCANVGLPDSCRLDLPLFHETSRADGSRLGGMSSYWTTETQIPSSSRAKLQSVQLQAATLVVKVYVTNELLAHAPALEQVLLTGASEEIAVRTDAAILNGQVGAFEGILSAPAAVTATKETGQQAGTLVYENQLKMMKSLFCYSEPNAAWLVSKSAQSQLLLNNSLDFALPGQPNGANSMGMPVISTEQSSPAGTIGDIVLADLTQYSLGTRGGVQSAVSAEVSGRFDAHESVFRFAVEICGHSLWANSVQAANSSDPNQSPFVLLETR